MRDMRLPIFRGHFAGALLTLWLLALTGCKDAGPGETLAITSPTPKSRANNALANSGTTNSGPTKFGPSRHGAGTDGPVSTGSTPAGSTGGAEPPPPGEDTTPPKTDNEGPGSIPMPPAANPAISYFEPGPATAPAGVTACSAINDLTLCKNVVKVTGGPELNCRVNLATRRCEDFLEHHALSAGFAHACILSPSGIATCWGDNSNGQDGPNVKTSDSNQPDVTSKLRSPLIFTPEQKGHPGPIPAIGTFGAVIATGSKNLRAANRLFSCRPLHKGGRTKNGRAEQNICIWFRRNNTAAAIPASGNQNCCIHIRQSASCISTRR